MSADEPVADVADLAPVELAEVDDAAAEPPPGWDPAGHDAADVTAGVEVQLELNDAEG